MAILRRGKPETRTHFERARDAFKKSKDEIRSTMKSAPCPTCGAPMLCTKSYRDKQYRFEGVCSVSEEHNIIRYGYVVGE
jgi:RNase P subunit RPR2